MEGGEIKVVNPAQRDQKTHNLTTENRLTVQTYFDESPNLIPCLRVPRQELKKCVVLI